MNAHDIIGVALAIIGVGACMFAAGVLWWVRKDRMQIERDIARERKGDAA